MRSLPIVWQRLVTSDGRTCDRCKATQEEMHRAYEKIVETLRPLGIEPRLETREINTTTFEADPSESNRIWISGKPMEDWLGAGVGSSRCCSACGDSQCRTVEFGAETFEVVPETMLIKAALIAASQLLDVWSHAHLSNSSEVRQY